MDNDRIKKYLKNELPPEERNAFEREMQDDPFLMEALDGLESFNQPPKLEEILRELEVKIDTRTASAKAGGKITFMNVFKLAAAACVIGIVAFTSWRYVFTKRIVDEQTIYASYFKPLTHPDAAVRGENKLSNDEQAIQAYEREDYFEAVRQYEKLVADNPANVKNKLFLGISYLATNQPKKAIDVLGSITTSEEFHYDIQWYLALAYIKTKEIQKAQDILQKIVQNENYYQHQAKNILTALEGKLANNN
ncbi:MAG: tetratricopeptide repeat protein [Sphingobacteriales bacterium]|nr:tetratricopeptide repeat protein [Sphingobacteriales bacterium]